MPIPGSRNAHDQNVPFDGRSQKPLTGLLTITLCKSL